MAYSNFKINPDGYDESLEAHDPVIFDERLWAVRWSPDSERPPDGVVSGDTLFGELVYRVVVFGHAHIRTSSGYIARTIVPSFPNIDFGPGGPTEKA